MTLVRKNTAPYLPSVFDELLNTDWLGGRVNSPTVTTPAVNIIEKDSAFELQVAIPGFKKEDFNIELDNDLLTISSKENDEIEGKIEGKFTRKEFHYASFKRSFNLPDSVNTAQIAASYESGILALELPKKEEAQVQPSRIIEIG
ncbi:Hsp20/alpha crystallin family protein [Dokdonia sp. Hel_I_53]|uniref:Hsp20/alpha crystallin family protein n=1 Tax=Dokdonia sp. Hel_I_53 TaxID=1566287 RepID=UPI00119A6519|nr:Hsp20/alpha crystallin family protein [Dokdonia sp. Hel_I_53]TVZ51735.1 heat shock protein Hsp20 [Dokdonia sp. Hel_I_53]